MEATRCLYCFDAPCTAACPTHIDVPRFIKKIATRKSARFRADDSRIEHSGPELFPRLPRGCAVRRRLRDASDTTSSRSKSAACSATRWTGFTRTRPRLRRRPTRGEDAWPASARALRRSPARPNCAAADSRSPFSTKTRCAGGLNTYGIAEYKLRPADSLQEVDLVRSHGRRVSTGRGSGSSKQSNREFDAVFLGVGLGPTHRAEIPGEDLPGVIDALRVHRRL